MGVGQASAEAYEWRRILQEWDLQNDLQIEECLRHSDTVYNLVGRDHTTKFVSAPSPISAVS